MERIYSIHRQFLETLRLQFWLDRCRSSDYVLTINIEKRSGVEYRQGFDVGYVDAMSQRPT
jgi:hypothetical protein